jgi:hypothetical protein
MMIDQWIFEVAIYRVSEDAWLDDVARRVNRRVDAELNRWPEDQRDQQRLRASITAQRIERPYGWEHNEVVAWIRIKADPNVIKAYAWRVQQERFRRGFTPFPFEGDVASSKVFEIWVDQTDSNLDIYTRLREELTALTGPTRAFAGHHLDLRVFDAIGRHVNWRVVLSS